MFWNWFKKEKKVETYIDYIEVPDIKVNLTFYGENGEKESFIERYNCKDCLTVEQGMRSIGLMFNWERISYLEMSKETIAEYFRLGKVEYIEHKMITVEVEKEREVDV